MKPSSSTQRRSSSTQLAGETPGDWGSMQTGAKFLGYSVQTRWIRSFCTRAHCALMAASPTWCSMEPARGEKKVTSLPRSRCSLSWAFSRLSRISSSLIFSSAGDTLFSDTWRFRQSQRAWGAVV